MQGEGVSKMGFERFTDKARKVFQLANQEAQDLNHEFMGCEHILLGLIKEGSGVAAAALKSFDVDLHTIRGEILKYVKKGPDMVTMGKLPQTPGVRKVIEYAIEEAINFNRNYVGTEHVLLGLLREGGSGACKVLESLGVNVAKVRGEIPILLAVSVKDSDVKEAKEYISIGFALLEDIERIHKQWEVVNDNPPKIVGFTCVPEGYMVKKNVYQISLDGNTVTYSGEIERIVESSKELTADNSPPSDLFSLNHYNEGRGHEKNRCLFLIRKKIEDCKLHGQEMTACVLMQLVKEIENEDTL